jgi:hypothetical protein
MLKIPVICLWLVASVSPAAQPFRIEVVDQENGWPVPMVELRSTHNVSFFTDNAGLIAIDEPDLLGREIWFHVFSDGYAMKSDGFGNAGVRIKLDSGGARRIEIERTMAAKRLGRLTGSGFFHHSAKLGAAVPEENSGVMGSDSVLLAKYRDKLFWLWGDTSVPEYPLGNFNSTAATTSPIPWKVPQPPIAPPMVFDYFKTDGKIRGIAPIEGPGPTWLGGMISVKDTRGAEKLVATYSKIENHLDEREIGLCAFDDSKGVFVSHRRIWKKGDGPKPSLIPKGHPTTWKDQDGVEWLLFGDPFPALKCLATFESWVEPSSWKAIQPPSPPRDAMGTEISPHRGSICWNAHRGRWVAIFTQNFGQPSAFGEIWYAEADSPFGPWGTAVKVLTHRNHTFYNPRIQHELTAPGAQFILFEGTYTAEFADHAVPTPRYNYNQILYRLDLDDPKLAAAQGKK